MLPLSQPALFSTGMGSYHSPDIRTLYYWLEAHGYHYYGSFGPSEYGRFASEAVALGAMGLVHFTSSIEVYVSGVVVAADEQAKQMLEELVSDPT